MPKVIFYPHKFILPKGLSVQGKTGETILDIALFNKIKMEHACEKSCACCTCHCIIRKGFSSLSPCQENEEDLLDKAWGLEKYSRLGCQARLGKESIEVEIPLYHVNHVNE
ncbi:ISC system 2Fe-2S type ferredoxin [Buchnera aphidicola]|uniref:2Fe-2S ferredoxin n=1 Tax=Buchnera aphidicola (Cinara cf. splendens/pseudotsugae 3390) TaxID=2518980 RepID=A0A451CXX1_9GAMM|nr:ISC system 2Fe-2S type ferredoxin [Buchnera aphidicola]VFP77979.1 2Fe-2S ferredoxin [Buchnera aphidicola (Cinara cf. splendens/pseudotsugae 3390)]